MSSSSITSGINGVNLFAYVLLVGLLILGLTPVLQVHSIYTVGVLSSSTSTSCDGDQAGDAPNYQSGVCYTTSSSSSRLFTCNPDGSQSSTYYGDSNCTSPVISGNLTAGSKNKCMPLYYVNTGAYFHSNILSCDSAGSAVTSDPRAYLIYSDSFPLSSDSYVTNVQYWSNANCSGEPQTTYANLTNGACITNLTYLDPGAGVRLTCMTDPTPYSSGGYGNVQYAAVWSGQPTLGQPTTCSNHGNMQGWNGYQTQIYGGCITLRLTSVLYGSYKFICPSFMPATPSSSSSSSSSSGVSSSSSTSPVSSSSSGPSSLQSSSSTTTSSTATTPTASSSTGTNGDVSSTGLASDSIGINSLLISRWLIASIILLHITLRLH